MDGICDQEPRCSLEGEEDVCFDWGFERQKQTCHVLTTCGDTPSAINIPWITELMHVNATQQVSVGIAIDNQNRD